MTTATVGTLPPALMAALQRHMREALDRNGISRPGAGGLIIFNVVRGMLTELGCLPDPTTDYGEIAEALTWQAQSALLLLRDLDAGQEVAATRWANLPTLARTMRETAAQIEHVVSLYEEGK